MGPSVVMKKAAAMDMTTAELGGVARRNEAYFGIVLAKTSLVRDNSFALFRPLTLVAVGRAALPAAS